MHHSFQVALIAAAVALLAAPAAAFAPGGGLLLAPRGTSAAPISLRPARMALPALRMQEGTGQSVIVIAKGDMAIASGPPVQQTEQQRYYSEQPSSPSMNPQGDHVMPKEGVNTMVLVGGGLAAVAGSYYFVKGYKARQALLVEEFGYSAMLYWGDVAGSVMNAKEYMGRIGPLINRFHRADMFKAYVKRLANDKPLGVTSIADFAAATTRLGVSKSVVHKVLQQTAMDLVPHQDPTETWERDENKPSVLGKLLWLTERCYPDPATIAKIRSRFPRSYGNEVIGILQRTLTEQAYKDVLKANGGAEKGLTPGYLEIGMTQGEAEDLIETILKETALAKVEAAKVAEEKAEAAQVQAIRDASVAAQKDKNAAPTKIKTHGQVDKPVEDAPVERASGTHEYECTNCGYTLFVAKGREFKFFGDNFRCAGCGSGKDMFKDNALEDTK